MLFFDYFYFVSSWYILNNSATHSDSVILVEKPILCYLHPNPIREQGTKYIPFLTFSLLATNFAQPNVY